MLPIEKIDKRIFNIYIIIVCSILIIFTIIFKFTENHNSKDKTIELQDIGNNTENISNNENNTIKTDLYGNELVQDLNMELYEESEETQISNGEISITYLLKNDEELYKEMAPLGFYKNLKEEIQKYINDYYENRNDIKEVEVLSNSYKENNNEVEILLLIDTDILKVSYSNNTYIIEKQ